VFGSLFTVFVDETGEDFLVAFFTTFFLATFGNALVFAGMSIHRML
jgi:hypothetical protein